MGLDLKNLYKSISISSDSSCSPVCPVRHVGVSSPAVGQVQSDAPSYVRSEAHVANGSQADVEEGDDAHPQIQNQRETLRPLHLVLQGKNLSTHRDTTRLLTG